jgi:hypothetical protein
VRRNGSGMWSDMKLMHCVICGCSHKPSGDPNTERMIQKANIHKTFLITLWYIFTFCRFGCAFFTHLYIHTYFHTHTQTIMNS